MYIQDDRASDEMNVCMSGDYSRQCKMTRSRGGHCLPACLSSQTKSQWPFGCRGFIYIIKIRACPKRIFPFSYTARAQ